MGTAAIGGWDIQSAAGRPVPLVALYHPDAARRLTLATAIVADGGQVVRLGPPAAGLRPSLDGCFDLLAFNAHLGWQERGEFIRLARRIAGSRPMLIFPDRDSLADRMLALGGGADEAVGWIDDPSDVLARLADPLRRARLAAGQLGFDELQIDLIERRLKRAGRLIRLQLCNFDLPANRARVPTD